MESPRKFVVDTIENDKHYISCLYRLSHPSRNGDPVDIYMNMLSIMIRKASQTNDMCEFMTYLFNTMTSSEYINYTTIMILRNKIMYAIIKSKLIEFQIGISQDGTYRTKSSPWSSSWKGSSHYFQLIFGYPIEYAIADFMNDLIGPQA